ncbi:MULTISPECIES: esterase-like activity of phytase family protein [unclassified Corynebacterium]|uniref:esterase-like activity of phytase family protein n=1 Tax=unclassified Corynebacterium TaxID=2624378 RepID=UPI001EF45C5B|nr:MULTISPECIES: esterase-like activity of phytase family protein [unclassified Corynebacterium]MCG7288622.1 esterase-like activity of phytase family protein [Corynebacterium sp. ACRPZ]MCG7293072.1 esterase-like activity of phytase family protein [Corynebacterium sp. ACRPY]
MNIHLPSPLDQIFKNLNLEQIIAAVAGAFVVGGLVGGAIGAAAGGSSEGTGSSDQATAPTQTAPDAEGPVLEGRAKLSALYQAPGPDSGKDAFDGNGQTHPFKGQVIPGFSGIIEKGDGQFYALPDNGFGSKENSSDFLLRIYTVKPNWETVDTAKDPKDTGGIEVLDYVSLKDPNNKISWDIVNNDTEDRLLTGADFDPESFVQAADGTFWVGEEFGPYILHVDKDGTLLDAPYTYPDVKSPSNPTLGAEEEPNLRDSKGFEAMATDGRYLYPIFEGYLDEATDKRVRVISQFDTETGKYTGKTWDYLAEDDDALIGDAFLTKDGRLLMLERDDFLGSEAQLKKVFEVKDFADAKAGSTLQKDLMADLLNIANPGKIGMVSDARAYGVGDPFQFALLSVETIIQLEDGRYLTALDNNFPGDDSRYRGKPDDTEMITFSVK